VDSAGVERRTVRDALPEEMAVTEAENRQILISMGISPGPMGRQWFILLPRGYASILALLDDLIERTRAVGIVDFCGPEWTQEVVREVRKKIRAP
jgi:hypothetical protein